MPDYGWAILGIVGAILGIMSLRVRFDLNEWMRDRHERRREQAKNICSHTKIGPGPSGEIAIGSWCHRPSGTTQWICQRCGYMAGSKKETDDLMRYWAENLEEYEEQERALEKHLY